MRFIIDVLFHLPEYVCVVLDHYREAKIKRRVRKQILDRAYSGGVHRAILPDGTSIYLRKPI
jgi:hypothetical protein